MALPYLGTCWLRFEHASKNSSNNNNFSVYFNGDLIYAGNSKGVRKQEVKQVTGRPGENFIKFEGNGLICEEGSSIDNVSLKCDCPFTTPEIPDDEC